MKMIDRICILLVFLLSGCSVSETGIISFREDNVDYRVEFFSPRIVRILSYPSGDTLVTKRLVVDTSLPRYTGYTVKDNSSEYRFVTPELIILFDKKEKAFEFREVGTDRLLLREKNNGKARTFRRDTVAEEPCLHVTQRFVPTEKEGLYGLGQYQTGVMNYRGDTALLLQANMDIVNPFLISTNRYGILWDNYSETRFRDNEQGYSFDSEVGDASDYYFVYGKNMDEVIAGYRTLTGRVPMFGKWVFGFWQSKERYRSFSELENVVKRYREDNIPLDNIVQDWEYWGDKAHWNGLMFDTLNFSRPKETIARLQNDYHVHFTLSVWPGFGKETSVYRDLDSIHALFDEPTWAGYKVFDAYNPYAREIFWNHLKRGLYDQGVDGWWMDATEPSFRDGFTQLKQAEKTKSAGDTYIGSFHRYLNVYSLELLRFLHDKLRAENDEKRVFILTRSAFASQQRYATAVWSGDVSASWENFRKQIAAGINLSMSGIPYWTSDIGGFFVTERDACFPKGLDDPAYKELYLRWFQFGCFSPLFRAHGTNVPREIWQFGEPGSVYYDTQLKYIRLRYKLLPYIYSVSRQVTERHGSVMKGLCMDFVSDTSTYDIADAYMFGPSLLVSPVVTPGAREKSTYLPGHSGTYWYDFYSGEAYRGGRMQKTSSPLDVIPLFVRGGSILPMTDVKQYVSECPDLKVELRIYTGADASFEWYDDEGDSYRYENGEFAICPVLWDESDKSVTLGDRIGKYRNMTENQRVIVKVYFPEQSTPIEREIFYTGEKIKIDFK